MEFQFDIGSEEKHTILFSFHEILGVLIIYVDGKEKIIDRIMWVKDLYSYKLNTGEKEKHEVRIDVVREITWPNPATLHYEVYLDGDFLMRR